jgi:hypothetical protein
MHKYSPRYLLGGLFALLFVIANCAFGQGVTTSGFSGFVYDSQGHPVAGATVTLVDVPSNTRAVTTTRGNGEYNFNGLRPGGPYAVTVSGASMSTVEKSGYYLDVGGSATVDFGTSDIVKMEAVSVTEGADTTFGSGNMGTATNFSANDIKNLVSVRQDIQDIMNSDPRAQLMQSANNDSEYTLSVEGQNPRQNLWLIDGVSASDNFGLNSNGYAGLRSPLPLPWIQSAALKLNEYDTAFSGYTGAIFDASIISGTNDFHGSLYELYSGTSFRGQDPNVGQLGPYEPMQQHTTGATIGGPIIKDKLFFFVGYEAFREIAAPPSQEFNPQDNAADSAVVSQIQAKAASLGDANQGTFTATNHTWQQSFIAKLDWNISDNQKFEFTFRHTAGLSPLFFDYTSSFETSLSGSWYNSFRTDQSYTAKLNSDWSSFIPGLSSEIEATYKRYDGTATLNGTDFPGVVVEGLNGTSLQGGSPPYELYLGTSSNYQDNNLYTWEQEEHAYGVYSRGDHTFKFGAAFDRMAYTDTFIVNYLGTYTFSNVQDFLNATPTGVGLEAPYPGYTLGSDVAHYYLMNISPLLQDTWTPSPNLTILAGVRDDYPYQPQKPILSHPFVTAYGYDNQATINGKYTVSPRLGFNYTVPGDQKTQVRGGAGLFLGASPAVWLENSYSSAGQLTSYTISNSSVPIPNYTFTGLNGGQPLPPVVLSSTGPSVDVVARDIHQPANWKENIAIDRDLGIWNMVLTVEGDWSQVQKDIYYREINLQRAVGGPQFMPDGAIRYAGNITPSNIGTTNFVAGFTTTNFYYSASSVSSNAATYFSPTGLTAPTAAAGGTSDSTTGLEIHPNLSAVYELDNTDKGGSQEYTVNLHRQFKGGWSWSAGYTHTHATQVEALGGTTASGSYGSNYFVNPNDNVAYRSAYAVPDKIVVTGTKEFHFFPLAHTATTFSGQWIDETGLPYSYTFKGDADGSGQSFSNSLFYVPTGPSDPNVTWLSAAEEQNFFNWLGANPKLAAFAGRVAPRNAFYSPWTEDINVHFDQELPVYHTLRLHLFADLMDLANALNHKWGQVADYGTYQNGFSSVAGTGYNPSGNGGKGQYIYTFNQGTLTNQTIYSDMSRWFLQVGVRLEF